jgi:SPP1 family predicted phage head-tail adaptor
MPKTPNLNRKIQIQQQTTQADAAGQPLDNWTTVCTCWAEIDIQNSALIYNTAAFMSKVVHRITIRWSRSYTFAPNMRVVYPDPATGINRVFNVEAVLNPLQSNQWVTFLAYELQAQE